MASYLLLLDYFAQPIQLNMDGKKKHPTAAGVFFTLLWVGVILYVAITQLIMIVNKSTPVTSREIRVLDVYPDIDLTSNRFLPVFIAYSNDVDIIPTASLSRYFTIYFEVTSYVTEDLGSSLKTKKFKTIVDSVPCKSLSISDRSRFSYFDSDSYLTNTFKSSWACSWFPNSGSKN